MVRVPGLLDDGRVMVAQRFGVDMLRRRVEELPRFQRIERRSHRPPRSEPDAVSLVHGCALPLEAMRGAERDCSPQLRAAGPWTGCSTMNGGRRDSSRWS